jgi:hypothetical protein
MNWFDRFLSRATLLLFLGIIVIVFAIPIGLQLAVIGFHPGSLDFSQYPMWIQVLLGFLGVVYLILEACFLLGGRKEKTKKQ